jgi:CDP-glucose 4,6-dehydratase
MKNKHILNFWKKKKIFITGHTGFKGAWLAFVLKILGAKVYGYSLNHKNKFDLFKQLDLKNFLDRSQIGNILNEKKLGKAIKKIKPDIVIHLAAQSLVRKSYQQPMETFKTNIIGSLNLLNICKELKSIKSILMVTTDKVYYNDNNKKAFKENDRLGGNDPYSSSKAAAELTINSYVKSFLKGKNKPLVATVRAGNVIGGGDWNQDRLIPDIIKSTLLKKKLIIRNPQAVRPWQHVLETVWAYMIISKKLYEGDSKATGAWNIGPDNTNNLEVINIVKFFKSKLKNLDYKIKNNNKLPESKILKLNNKKFKYYFDWKPVLKKSEMFKLTIDWYSEMFGKKLFLKLSKEQVLFFFQKIK